MSEFVEIRRKVCARSRKWRIGVVVDMLDVDDILVLLPALLCSGGGRFSGWGFRLCVRFSRKKVKFCSKERKRGIVVEFDRRSRDDVPLPHGGTSAGLVGGYIYMLPE